MSNCSGYAATNDAYVLDQYLICVCTLMLKNIYSEHAP